MKKDNGTLIVFIILGLIILGIIGFFVYDQGYISLGKKKQNNKETKEINIKEEILNNSEIENKLKNNIEILEKLEFLGNNVEHYYREGDIYYKNIKEKDIKKGVKLYAVLNYVYFDNNYFIDDNKTHNDLRKSTDFNKINKLYKSIFGEDASADDFGINNCPHYEYDSAAKKIYGYAACGGTSQYWILTKPNKFTNKGNNYYVYVNFAVVESGEKVYTNYDKTKIYNGNIDNTTIRDKEKFFTEENKSNFSEYKYTFKKTKAGNYKFISIEKIK